MPGLRLWAVIFLLWMSALALTGARMFDRYEAGDAAAFSLWITAFFCFYLSLCNALLPLPTSWIVMLVASPDVELFSSPLERILIIAVAGGLATTIANLNEYHVLGFFFRRRLGDKIRHTSAYRWGVRWFDSSPFQTLALISFIPIPVDVVRWLAILRRYPRLRFAAAYFIGRSARYALLATLSVAFSLSPTHVAIIQGVLVLLVAARLIGAGVAQAWSRRRSARAQRPENADASQPGEALPEQPGA